jgi:predicted acylesterase/phospholipase RssA
LNKFIVCLFFTKSNLFKSQLIMSTKKIGLVLSGGGYKGIAHAGALQFLKEQNITPSVIAGTSSGSIVLVYMPVE